MRLDNSAFTMYMRCAKMYYERYEADAKDVTRGVLQGIPTTEGSGTVPGLQAPDVLREASQAQGSVPALPKVVGLELIERKRDGLAFGTYFHALADRARRAKLGTPNANGENKAADAPPELLRAECESVFAAYEQHWLGNDYTYLESERTHVIPVPETQHELVVKIDAVVRHDDWTIGPLDTKTEEKPGYNFREDWAGRTQASLYLWALQVLYPKERVSRLVVDVVTRGSSRRAPTFTRLDDIARPPEALADAVRNFVWVCDDIERSRASGWWRSNMNICKDSWKRCDYYDLHVYGRTAENLAKFRPAEAYLDV